MKYFLFLDDIRYLENMVVRNPIYDERQHNWITVKDYKQFIETIKLHGVPELVSFDHDIGEEHYGIDYEEYRYYSSEQLGLPETGYDCADWMIKYCDKHDFKYPECIVHSANPVGRENIKLLLTRNNIKVVNI